MRIGDTVNYIREHKDGVSEGTATLTGIGLNPDKRVIVLLREGDKAFNTFEACVNPSPEFCEKFRVMVAEVEILAKEGNALLKSIAAGYDEKLAAKRDALLGEPLKIDGIALAETVEAEKIDV